MKFYIDMSNIDLTHALELKNKLSDLFPGCEVWIDRGLHNINDVLITFYDVDGFEKDYNNIVSLLRRSGTKYAIVIGLDLAKDFKDNIFTVNTEDEAIDKIKDLCPLYLQEFVD